MNSALAIASVTALLKGLLEDGLVSRGIVAAVGAEVQISALPPDRVRTGEDERPQLNLFLYQVTPHTHLRAPASRPAKAQGGRRSLLAPLGLDLHYLLSAYGAQDLQTEVLLGHGLHVLHDTPVIEPAAIRASLGARSSTAEGRIVPPTVAALGASGLADQVERIVISPHFLNTEELSRLWSASQAHLRPSASYKVSLVLAGVRDDGDESDVADGRD